MSSSDISLVDAARARLDAEWGKLSNAFAAGPPADLPDEIREAIARSVNSATKTYRYVLPTQILAKAVNPALDCRSVQANCGLVVAFDARSLCHSVVVPFDRQNHDVLGGSTEPYLNNPLRIPAIVETARSAQKNKAGFDDLRLVLDFAQRHIAKTPDLLQLVLQTIEDRLALARVIYSVPNRVSLQAASQLFLDFSRERSGGIRMQALVVALFRTVGARFQLYDDVRSENVNAADASTGSAADIECLRDGAVALAVEVKDRELVLRHVQDKLPAVREKGISELLFIVQNGIDPTDAAAVAEVADRQFATGQNIYATEFNPFLETCLVLLGEVGRRRLLEAVGQELNERKADLIHRQAWRNLLAAI